MFVNMEHLAIHFVFMWKWTINFEQCVHLISLSIVVVFNWCLRTPICYFEVCIFREGVDLTGTLVQESNSLLS